jgi:hypothetical protein
MASSAASLGHAGTVFQALAFAFAHQAFALAAYFQRLLAGVTVGKQARQLGVLAGHCGGEQ